MPVEDVPLPAGEPVGDVGPSPAAATPKAPAPSCPNPCDVQPGPPPDEHPPCTLASASTITAGSVAGAAVLPEFVCAPAIAA